MAAYNAAKFAVRGYTEAIAQEARMQRLPLTVHCVHPGGILTNIARNAQVRGEWVDLQPAFDRIAHTTPQRCAEVILDGVTRGRARILVGLDAWVLHVLQQLLDVRALDMIRRVTSRLVQRSDHTSGVLRTRQWRAGGSLDRSFGRATRATGLSRRRVRQWGVMDWVRTVPPDRRVSRIRGRRRSSE